MYSVFLMFGNAVSLEHELVKQFNITNILFTGSEEDASLFCLHYNACKEENIPFNY